MHIGKKKITISALIVVVFVSVIVWAATSYPNAAISFSGIKMVANGSTTQGFVDISLKNIDSTAISYCIEYDKNYIELSDVATNTPIKNPTTSSGASDIHMILLMIILNKILMIFQSEALATLNYRL